MARTAFQLGHRVLYHWQRLDADKPNLAKRLSTFIETKRLYCSSPGAFNDPWDCRPHFSTQILQDGRELRKHADWAVDVCNRRKPMSPGDTARMHHRLLNDVPYATQLLAQISEELAPAINQQYRVYCLGPDPTNVLMWSHHSDDHRGICLEFSLRNEVMCFALECEYLAEFALMRPYCMGEEKDLRVLLAKSDVWAYEREFRLVAQERSQAIGGTDTLMTDDSFLQLPANALTAIIVGCQGDYDKVKTIVDAADPSIRVKRAMRGRTGTNCSLRNRRWPICNWRHCGIRPLRPGYTPKFVQHNESSRTAAYCGGRGLLWSKAEFHRISPKDRNRWPVE